MRLWALHGGTEVVPATIFDPFGENRGEDIEIPFFSYLVQHERGTVLFDCGTHVDAIEDPHGRLGAAVDQIEVRMRPGDGIVELLEAVGVAPGEVDLVVQSHLHYDHAGGLEFFPEAEVLVQRSELAFARQPPIYQRATYVAADFDRVSRWRQIDGELDLFGDGTLTLLPTPGHTAGHQSLLVRLPGQTLILAADAAYTAESLERSILPGILWSPDETIATYERLRDLRDREGATVIFTHDPDYAANVRVAPGAWYE